MKTITAPHKPLTSSRFQPRKMAEKKTDKKPFFSKDVRPGTLIVVE
jgi:hypothetical protein